MCGRRLRKKIEEALSKPTTFCRASLACMILSLSVARETFMYVASGIGVAAVALLLFFVTAAERRERAESGRRDVAIAAGIVGLLLLSKLLVRPIVKGTL